MNLKDDQLKAITDLLHTYNQVATGATRGAGGTFYADGKGTLNAVTVPVEQLEALAAAFGQKVHGRTKDDRYAS